MCQLKSRAGSAETAESTPVGPKKRSKNKKYFLRESAIFQSLMRGTARRHGFLHIGAHLVAKRALGRMHASGADPPHFHMHIGKIGQFFKIRGSP